MCVDICRCTRMHARYCIMNSISSHLCFLQAYTHFCTQHTHLSTCLTECAPSLLEVGTRTDFDCCMSSYTDLSSCIAALRRCHTGKACNARVFSTNALAPVMGVCAEAVGVLSLAVINVLFCFVCLATLSVPVVA